MFVACVAMEFVAVLGLLGLGLQLSPLLLRMQATCVTERNNFMPVPTCIDVV